MVVFPIWTEVTPVKGPAQGHWTRTDWETLPDDGNRYEIIDGVLYVSTAPSFFHQWIIKRLYRLLGAPAEDQGLAEIALAPIGVFMPGCEPVQPDFVVVLTEHIHIIHDRRIWGVPDLIVEVLSPSNRDYDEDVKKNAYAAAGLGEYAVIDPMAREVRCYRLVDGAYGQPAVYRQPDAVTFACLPSIPVQVQQLFDGAPDTTL